MIALYERVSTEKQDREGHSIPEQKERLEKYCSVYGWKDFVHYTDAGFSGAKTDRPALQRLIKDIEKGKVNKVLVYKLDRLSRSQKDTLWLIEDKMLSHDCDFISISENFDTSTPFGRAMIGILAVFAQLEREQIKERMSMGKMGRAKAGKRNGGHPPIGYEIENGDLVINEYEAMQIREIHSLYQQGYSVRHITKDLKDRGLKHKYGFWNEVRVGRTLSNPIYIGKVIFKGELYDGVHEPIIDMETFERTNAILKTHDYSSHSNRGKRSYLSGLLFCKQCGARYGMRGYKCRNTRYEYYRCYSQLGTSMTVIKNPNCKNKSYKMDELDQMVFDEIRKLSMETVELPKKEDNSKEIKMLKKEIAKIENQKSRFMDLYGLGSFSLDDIQSKIEPLNEQKRNLEKEIDSLQNKLPEKEAVRLLSTWSDVLESGDKELIRSLLSALINKIEIDGENVSIYWNFN